MEIHNKRGVWYVINPPAPKKQFDSEEEALAYVKGEDPVEPDDDDDEDEWYDE
tara:strand:- start:1582 stop:1740 length:159 start_codon:yes stop_codon:yes gene_type:complete